MIRVVDVETAGLEPPAGVCQIGWCDVIPPYTDFVTEVAKPWSLSGGRGEELCHPGCPIPPEVSAVNHLIDEDVRAAPPWADVCLTVVNPDFREVGEPAWEVLAAHKAQFERQWLADEMTGGLPWICTYKCAMRLWPDAPAYNNQTLRYWLKPDGLNREIAGRGHSAFRDAYVTAHLLRDMLNEGATVEQMIEWSGQPALQVTCQIGKWRGRPWTEVDDGMLDWILGKDFDEDVKFSVRTEIERRRKEHRHG